MPGRLGVLESGFQALVHCEERRRRRSAGYDGRSEALVQSPEERFVEFASHCSVVGLICWGLHPSDKSVEWVEHHVNAQCSACCGLLRVVSVRLRDFIASGVIPYLPHFHTKTGRTYKIHSFITWNQENPERAIRFIFKLREWSAPECYWLAVSGSREFRTPTSLGH